MFLVEIEEDREGTARVEKKRGNRRRFRVDWANYLGNCLTGYGLWKVNEGD